MPKLFLSYPYRNPNACDTCGCPQQTIESSTEEILISSDATGFSGEGTVIISNKKYDYTIRLDLSGDEIGGKITLKNERGNSTTSILEKQRTSYPKIPYRNEWVHVKAGGYGDNIVATLTDEVNITSMQQMSSDLVEKTDQINKESSGASVTLNITAINTDKSVLTGNNANMLPLIYRISEVDFEDFILPEVLWTCYEISSSAIININDDTLSALFLLKEIKIVEKTGSISVSGIVNGSIASINKNKISYMVGPFASGPISVDSSNKQWFTKLVLIDTLNPSSGLVHLKGNDLPMNLQLVVDIIISGGEYYI